MFLHPQFLYAILLGQNHPFPKDIPIDAKVVDIGAAFEVQDDLAFGLADDEGLPAWQRIALVVQTLVSDVQMVDIGGRVAVPAFE